MSGRHTPGPWHVEGGNQVWAGDELVAGAAVMRMPHAANARLIAAAPDLLACAIKLRAVADWLPHPHCVEALEMADAAIARATGAA
jgi:hypothetical protein